MQCILCILLFSLTDCAHEVTPVPVYSRDAMLTYLSFAQINDNELRPKQGEQPRG